MGKDLTHHPWVPSVVRVPQVEQHWAEQEAYLYVLLYKKVYAGQNHLLNSTFSVSSDIVFNLEDVDNTELSPVVLK